jgi:hydroxymethylglutaryl-CoA lyase
MKQRIYINEVAVRDGFQIERDFVPTETKVALIDELSRTGLAKIEVTSFVSPKAVPNMRDAEQVLNLIDRVPGVIYAVLVPNLRGVERAIQCNVDEINLFCSASESHNRANVNRTIAQSVAGFGEIMQALSGSDIKVNCSISTAFGCPFEGKVAAEKVFDLVDQFLALGFDGVTIADTTGMANPKQVRELMLEIAKRCADVELTLHFHNTRGMGLANVLAGLEAGVVRYDASIGGLGGCPFAPGASGNICTEDLVHMLEAMGYNTGVNLDRLLKVAHKVPKIVGHDVPGQVLKAGKATELHTLDSVGSSAG